MSFNKGIWNAQIIDGKIHSFEQKEENFLEYLPPYSQFWRIDSQYEGDISQEVLKKAREATPDYKWRIRKVITKEITILE
jgi:hypothetical protein